ncbi:MAG TPA: hypothetical protein VK698_20070 [Kofleriaceae bacterium]|nr:hypothetical protein [Kofleriaceae bacterium]
MPSPSNAAPTTERARATDARRAAAVEPSGRTTRTTWLRRIRLSSGTSRTTGSIASMIVPRSAS